MGARSVASAFESGSLRGNGGGFSKLEWGSLCLALAVAHFSRDFTLYFGGEGGSRNASTKETKEIERRVAS